MDAEGSKNTSPTLAAALESLLISLAATEKELHGAIGDETDGGWRAVLERNILPRLRGDLPLIVGFCGGGNTGKSTLFNALAGLTEDRRSNTGPLAGLTRRALLAIPRAIHEKHADLLHLLFQHFGSIPEPFDPVSRPAAMTEPGPPLYILTDHGLPDAILVDLPDVDVANNKCGYANRTNSGKVLAACDLLLLVAVNQNYSNKDITDFMRETVFTKGLRPAILVYRYSVELDATHNIDPDDIEHIRSALATMTALLYPGVGAPPVRESFLVCDDAGRVKKNGVPDVTPISSGAAATVACRSDGISPLAHCLATVDRAALYRENTREAVENGLAEAEKAAGEQGRAYDELDYFHRRLEEYTDQLAREALTHFPQEELREVLAECWRDEQSAFHRFSCALGRATKNVVDALKAKLQRTPGPSGDPVLESLEKGRSAFLKRCAALRQGLLEGKPVFPMAKAPGSAVVPPIYEDEYLSVPVCHQACIAELNRRAFREQCAPALETAWNKALHLPEDIRGIIRPLVKEARKKMSGADVAKEYAKSLANLGVQVAAVVYVVATGGATLLVFGGNDVAALLVILPVLGMEHMPEEWRRKVWRGILGHWNDRQAPMVRQAIQDTLTGGFLQKGKDTLAELEPQVKDVRDQLQKARVAFAAWRDENVGTGGHDHDD